MLSILTLDKNLLLEELEDTQFKLISLCDRGQLKYPTEPVIDVIVFVWKIFIAIEQNSQLMEMLVNGPSRNIITELAIIFLENGGYSEVWNNSCCSCKASRWSIARKLIFVTANCVLANKVNNYNSLVTTKKSEKRKLKKFNA